MERAQQVPCLVKEGNMKAAYIIAGVSITLFLICIAVSDWSKGVKIEADADAAEIEEEIKYNNVIRVYFYKHSQTFVAKKCIDGYWYLISAKGHIEQMTERKGDLALPIECKEVN
jgi:hypothetical protein